MVARLMDVEAHIWNGTILTRRGTLRIIIDRRA